MVLLTALVIAHVINRNTDLRGFATVSTVCFNHLSFLKHVDEFAAEDVDVWIEPTWKRAIDVSYVSTIDRESNFIPNTRAFEFVRIPTGTERTWIRDFEVSSINCHHAPAIVAVSILFTILPTDLLNCEC